MNALLFTNLFPSTAEPTRGLFNLRGFAALASLCNVRVVAPVAAWRRLARPRELVNVLLERHNGVAATYPTYWTIPRIGLAMHAGAMYRSVRGHAKKLHAERPFDVVLGAFAYPDAVAASRLARELNLPFVAFVLGSDINELAQRPALKPQILDALLHAETVVAVSHGLAARVVELGVPPKRVVVQHNGVDGECFRLQDQASVRAALGLPAGHRWLCYVGNLVHEKGPDVLLEAFERLSSTEPDLSLAIIGDGVLKPQLACRVDEHGLAGRVTFLGRLPPERVALWLSASDTLCLPSRREGCPNVVLEALASGRPVVASAVGGVPELVNQNNGIMVPSEDAGALASGIRAVLNQSWSPALLRSSVPSLSWMDLARVLHEAFVKAAAESQQQRHAT